MYIYIYTYIYSHQLRASVFDGTVGDFASHTVKEPGPAGAGPGPAGAGPMGIAAALIHRNGSYKAVSHPIFQEGTLELASTRYFGLFHSGQIFFRIQNFLTVAAQPIRRV